MSFLSELTIGIPRLPCGITMPTAVLTTVKLVNSVTSDSDNSFNFVISAWPTSVSRLSWSHVLMNREEIDDK